MRADATDGFAELAAVARALAARDAAARGFGLPRIAAAASPRSLSRPVRGWALSDRALLTPHIAQPPERRRLG